MNNEILIEAKNVGIFYKKKKSFFKVNEGRVFWALQDVSFDLYKGEVLGVIGRNGAGKSTLLSLLAGIISPSTGNITYKTESISLLSLQAGFEPFLSGRKNILLSGMFLGLSYEYMQSKVDEIIEFSELGEFIDEPVTTYSAGMKTRLGFSTAIQVCPDIILIDEVLGVGDFDFRRKSSRALKAKIKKAETTAVIVSHNRKTIIDLCDRVLIVEKGKSLFLGVTDEAIAFYDKMTGRVPGDDD